MVLSRHFTGVAGEKRDLFRILLEYKTTGISAVELSGIHFQGKQLFYCHLVFLLNGVTS